MINSSPVGRGNRPKKTKKSTLDNSEHSKVHDRDKLPPRETINLVERTEVEPFDRIAGIEWNAVEVYRICCMARLLRSLRQVATLRHGHMARRFAPAFRAQGVCEHI